jgi:hypothetical protein
MGASLQYRSSASKGAMVGFPNGGDRRDVLKKNNIHKLALRCGASWYKYANEERGRMAPNGSLYVVTGCDKANTWGLASWSCCSEGGEISLAFTLKQSEAGASFSYSHESCTTATVRVGPITPSQKTNQCVFLRGFKVAVREEPLARVRGSVSLTSIIGSPTRQIIRISGGTPYADSRRWPPCSSSSASGPNNSASGPNDGSNSSPTSSSSPSTSLFSLSENESADTSDDDASVYTFPTSEVGRPTSLEVTIG